MAHSFPLLREWLGVPTSSAKVSYSPRCWCLRRYPICLSSGFSLSQWSFLDNNIGEDHTETVLGAPLFYFVCWMPTFFLLPTAADQTMSCKLNSACAGCLFPCTNHDVNELWWTAVFCLLLLVSDSLPVGDYRSGASTTSDVLVGSSSHLLVGAKDKMLNLLLVVFAPDLLFYFYFCSITGMRISASQVLQVGDWKWDRPLSTIARPLMTWWAFNIFVWPYFLS